MEIDVIIKLILGLIVVVAVGVGISFFFKDSVISFFSGFSENVPETFLGMIK
jgi:hypothetical protein